MLSVEMRVRLKLLKKLMPGYVFFFGSLVLISLVYGFMAKSIIGVTFLFVAFVSLRYTYRKKITYHADTTRKCIALSILMFALASIPLLVFNMKITLLSSIPIAIGMTWLLHNFGIKKELETELLSLKAPKKFDLDNCTEAELIERCKLCFKHDVEYKTERAIKHFTLKLPHEEIDVNPEQSKKERYRFRKILK